MSDGYKTAMIVNKLFDIECSTDEAIELEHLMWGTQICRTCAGNSVGDYAIRIQELEQQLTSAHREGWEQAKKQVIEEWEKPHGLTDGSKFIDRLRNMEYPKTV